MKYLPMFIFHFHAAILSVIYGGMVKCNLIKKEIVVWSFFTSSFTLDHKVWNFFRTFKFSMKLYLPLVSILNSEGAKRFLWGGNFNLLMSIYIYSQNFVGCLKPFDPPLYHFIYFCILSFINHNFDPMSSQIHFVYVEIMNDTYL